MSQEPNVKSIPVTDSRGVAARITVSTDIVDYMASARVFGQEDLAQAGAHGRFQKRMIAIPDRRTSVVAPMVLSIGSNNGLYLVRRQTGAGDAGWTRSDLGPSLKKFGLASVQVRAVGAAVGRNPLSIVVPCHRVLGSDGSLTGYAGGLKRKGELLRLESASM